MPGRVQLSNDTAQLLIKAGKDSWIEERDTLVEAKGKGSMKTYWLVLSGVTNTVATAPTTKEGGTTREIDDETIAETVDRAVKGLVRQST